ncbi:hypothetical protein SAMN04488120_11811 [Fontimonas thermophila]|uniref:Yip1 domain-containing protein n=1 Tax=Fontimonas thermophila TaxID=1076937 RepID=A0A1I2KEU0_9GAMM|nr:hypothetical protein [Fontimonas thermophila]SFF65532.1 hypothetical protein SAMN04488120_11811 [Fontimonas thermophila]
MFAQVLTVTLRILGFRAGPQDFPYDPRLTWPLVSITGLANFLVFVQVLPAVSSAAMAAAMIAGTALVTRSILRARNLAPRFNQTFNSLLATAAVLTLLLLPLFMQVAPVLREIAAKPQLLEQPDALRLPQGVVFTMNLLNFWNFAVTAHIFRHAANVQLWVGVIIALIIAFVVLFFVAFAGSLVGAMFGAA